MKWTNIHEHKPDYGAPVLIKLRGVTQYVTWILDGSDDSLDWLEMCNPHVDGEVKAEFAMFVRHDIKIEWMYLPI